MVAIANLSGKPRVTVPLKGMGAIAVRPGDSDYDSFRQVFIYRQFDIEDTPQGARLRQFYNSRLASGGVPVIIDAGANVGASAIWFAQQFPRCSVFAIEPDKDNAELCRQNCASLGNIEVIEAAIGGRSGAGSVERQDKSWSSQTRRSDDEGGVPIVSVADILARSGRGATPLIVKVDIEGFEADLFAEGTEWVASTAAIFIETHDWLFPGQRTSQAMQRAVMGQGFEILVRRENLLLVRDTIDDVTHASVPS
jgi:FkbM family methyltransferase